MYKLLVVEDEYIIRKGIVENINWQELGFAVVGDAATGKEGLQCVEEVHPDVILTDVRMPVMDGLLMSEKVLEKYPDTKIIIISGFADFDYAQQAIRFRVFDYLLKPTNKDRIIQCFLRLRSEMDSKRSEVMRYLNMQSKMYNGLVKLREDFFNNVFSQDLPAGQLLQERLDYLEIDMLGEIFAVGVVRLEFGQNVLNEMWKNDKKLLKFSYYNIFTELLGGGEYGMAVVRDIKEIAVVFNFKDKPYTKSMAADILKIGAATLCDLLGAKNAQISSGLGLEYVDFPRLKESYAQAKSAVDKTFFDSVSDCYIYHPALKTGADEKKCIEEYPSMSDQIVDATLAGNADIVQTLIVGMFAQFEKAGLESQAVMDYAYNLCFKLLSDFSALAKTGTVDAHETDYKKKIYGMSSMSVLQSYIVALFQQKAAASFAKKNDNTQNIIESVKRYINKNYAADISLEMLSKKMFISSSYLSFLFKNMTGESYSAYLKNIRLGKARELIEKKDDLKVYEVCYMVGYKEYKYFSQQFKKAFGTNPTELRKKNGKGCSAL